jgi:hypothetical protein
MRRAPHDPLAEAGQKRARLVPFRRSLRGPNR